MQLVSPEFAKRFVCAAGDCPDTCCRDWQIIIDDNTLEYYQTLSGALGDAVRAAIVPEQEPYFRLSEDGTCVLLSQNGLCPLQKTYGEAAQCKVCRTYPRFVRQYGTLREEGVSLSCPEALRLLLENRAPMRLIREDGEFPIEPNDYDADVFFALKQGRALAFSLVQDRRYRIDERLFLLLNFAQELQYCLSGKDYARVDRVCRRFSAPTGRAAVLRSKKALQYRCVARYRLLEEWTEFFAGLEILSPRWKALLGEARVFFADAGKHGFYRAERQDFDASFRDNEYEYEHILAATLFKYWLEAADDGILLPKVQQAIVSLLLLREFNLMHWCKTGSYQQIETAHRIARESEHNEDNLEAMRQAFLYADCFAPKQIKRVI